MRSVPFPDPREAPANGLVACGGDLHPALLLSAYAHGIFPWYDEGPILWHSPEPRFVLLPENLRINRTLEKNLRRTRYEVRLDTAFEEVIRACAERERPDQEGTWITPEMIAAYCELHELGFAHCAESWREDELMGGIYGVSLGRAFFGESMFAHESDASKIALVGLIRQLEAWQFRWLDCQVHTEHMERLGAVSWPRDRFLDELESALNTSTRRGRWTFDTKST